MATLYPQDTVERCRALKAQGMRTGLIAKELGVHPDTVRKWNSGELRTGPGKRIVFTPEEVLAIRHARAVEGVTQDELAERWGTGQGTIGRITRGDVYKDVGGYILAPHCRAANRKLTDAKARQIRDLRTDHPGTRGARRLARRFGVSLANIYLVLSGEIWPAP